MDAITILKTQVDSDKIINLFKKKFFMNKFPLSLSHKGDMKFKFINSRFFDVKFSYNQFCTFLTQNNINQFYVLPAEAPAYNWSEYEKQHFYNKETKYKYRPVLFIKEQPNFDLIYKFFLEEHFYYFTEFYLFSDNLDWVIHYIPHRNCVILFFEENISPEVFLEDEIKELEELIENATWEDGFNLKEIEALKNYWFPQLINNG